MPTSAHGFLRRVWKIFSAARRVLRAHPDMRTVFAVTWSPAGVAAWLLSFVFSIRYFVAAHGLDILEPQRSRKYTMLLKRTLGSAAKIFPVSRFTRQELIKLGFSAGRIIVSPCGTNPRKFEGQEEEAAELRREFRLDGKTVLLTVGRLVRRKGHDLVIDILEDLCTDHPDLVYLIAGEGPERANLEDRARREGVEANVVFAGFVPDAKLPALYQACDLFVMPSRTLPEEGEVEGFGIVFLEANASGIPVIGCHCGGMGDAIVDEVTGLLVTPGDRPALKGAILRLLGSADLRRRLGEQGRERVREKLNWPVVAEELFEKMGDA